MKRPILEKKNYQIIIVGIILIATGFILMSGGRSDDPEVFNPEIYNFRRIRLAPTLILIGLALQAYGILYNKKK
jgi:uncharacterized membrane protein